MIQDVVDRAKATLTAAVLSLPPGALRLIAGRPVMLDGQTLDVDCQALLRLMKLAREEPIESLPVSEGRTQTLRQAVMVAGEQPIGSVRELEVDGAEGPLPARLYVPRADSDALLLFIHGGGWVYGDLDSHDATCRFLAERAGVRVLSIGYRLAPEAPFPAAYDDCLAAYRWTVKNADSLGATTDRIAVGGDSAGGSLSALTAIAAAHEGLPLKFQLLIYPSTDFTHSTESHVKFDDGFFLTRRFMDVARDSYLGSDNWTNPQASPLYAEVPPGLAPAYVVTAGFDPLRDEGEAYARKLADAGVAVELKRFPGLIHGFANMVGVGRSCPAAMAEVAAVLRDSL